MYIDIYIYFRNVRTLGIFAFRHRRWQSGWTRPMQAIRRFEITCLAFQQFQPLMAEFLCSMFRKKILNDLKRREIQESGRVQPQNL